MKPGALVRAYGTPVPQGQMSYNASGHGYSTNAKRLKPWRAAVEKAVIEQAAAVPTIDVPAFASIIFHLPRPKSHYRTGRFAHLLRDDAPQHPTAHQLGDIDKLQRAVHDALVDAGLLADDSLIVRSCGLKCWADDANPPGAFIEVRPFGGGEA